MDIEFPVIVVLLINNFCFPLAVLDDDDTSITAGSIVTVQVYLKRQMMEVLFDKEDLAHADEEHDNLAIGNEETESNKDQVG